MTHNRLIRSCVTVLLFGRILWSYIWLGVAVLPFVRDVERRHEKFRLRHERNARRIYNAFVRLKGVYIKLGQFLSTQVMLPPAYLAEMAKMQDRVPRAATEAVHRRIEQELGQSVGEAFAAFEDAPLACASIGQVHRCRTRDGRDAVLKVKYPGIERSFQRDLDLLRRLVPVFIKIIERIYYREATGIDHRAIVGEFVHYIGLELDYANEVANHRRMLEIMRDRPDVVVPELFEAYCTDALIGMAYAEGRPMHAYFVDPEVPDARKNRAYEVLVDALLHQVSKYGFFQADTHPGNFLIADDGQTLRLVMLDFGCAKQLPENFRQCLLRAVQGYINRDPEMSAQAFWNMGFRTVKHTLDSLVRWADWVFELVDILVDHFNRGASIADFVKENAVALGEQHHRLSQTDRIDHIPEAYVMFGRALATPPVPFDVFQPTADLQALVMPHLANLAAAPPGEANHAG